MDYCGRGLTNLEDRPIAFVAVAESFADADATLTTSDYLAGLWRPTLLRDLLRKATPRAGDLNRLKGPSWSWT